MFHFVVLVRYINTSSAVTSIVFMANFFFIILPIPITRSVKSGISFKGASNIVLSIEFWLVCSKKPHAWDIYAVYLMRRYSDAKSYQLEIRKQTY